MKLQCPCGQWHDMSPTMLLMVVDAFICGELQTVMGGNGVVVGCVTEAMTVERVEDFHKRYRGKITSIGSDNG